jgi:carbonic anhydrase
MTTFYDLSFAKIIFSSLLFLTEDPRALSVVAVFLEPVNNIPEFYDNPAFRKIAQNMPLKFQETVQKINSSINLKSLLPQSGEIFYKYSGSLTTPGCNEEVQWTIVPKPVQVSVKNYRKFYGVRDEDGHVIGDNYRPVQPLNARTIDVFRKF